MSGFLKILRFVMLLAFVMPAFSVQAQDLLADYKKPMPEIGFMPKEEFDQSTILYKDTPMGDKTMSYTIRIPRDWVKGKDMGLANFALSNKVLSEVARFDGPPRMGLQSYMTIEALVLDHSMTAEQWFLQYMLANGYAIQGFKVLDLTRAEAMYVTLVGTETYVIRAALILNGKNVLLAKYYLPSDYWDAEKQIQAQSLDSLRINNPEHDYIEPMLPYHFLDIATMTYPESWEIRAAPIRTIDRMDAEFFNINSEEVIKRQAVKNLDGIIKVSLVSYFVSESLESEINAVVKSVEKQGLELGDLIESKNDFKVHDNFEFIKVDVFKLSNLKSRTLNYEYWVASLAAGEYYYFITLIAPSRDDDYFVWVRDTEIFRSMIASIVPQIDNRSD